MHLEEVARLFLACGSCRLRLLHVFNGSFESRDGFPVFLSNILDLFEVSLRLCKLLPQRHIVTHSIADFLVVQRLLQSKLL